MALTAALDELARLIEAAKPRALGGGSIVDRRQALRLMEQVRAGLPAELERAAQLIASSDELLASARTEADEIVRRARERADGLVREHDVTELAEARAMATVVEAQRQADHKRAEVDAYVESKLASFEGFLEATASAVANGRRKLAGEVHAEAGGDSDIEVRSDGVNAWAN